MQQNFPLQYESQLRKVSIFSFQLHNMIELHSCRDIGLIKIGLLDSVWAGSNCQKLLPYTFRKNPNPKPITDKFLNVENNEHEPTYLR